MFKCLLCAKYCAKHFTNIILFNHSIRLQNKYYYCPKFKDKKPETSQDDFSKSHSYRVN